jgi:hypothetical protein
MSGLVIDHEADDAPTLGNHLVPLAPMALTATEAFKPGGVDALLTAIEAQVRAERRDISTPAGRAAIKSLAYKVARSKTGLDAMGKDLVAEWKKQAGVVDAERRSIRERLDALADEVRAPLTAWEAKEAARIAAHEAALADMCRPADDATSAGIARRLDELRNLPPREWGEFELRAAEVLARAIADLESEHAAAVQREAEAAELARLRAEEAERQRQEAARIQAEREARIAAEAAEAARIAAEQAAAAEAARVAAEAEAARVAAEARAAAEAARIEREKAEAIAKAEAETRAAEQRVRDMEAAAQRQVEANERHRVAAIAQAEAEKAEAIAAERRRVEAERAEAARIAAEAEAEAAARASRQSHRAKINRAAADALALLNLTEEQAKAIITAVARGEIPHMKMEY